MIKFIVVIMISFGFSACSFKAKPNAWKYKSINAFSSYTQNFLSAKDTLAKNDLKRAIEHAKSSANLTQLSRIYLGECALNISVGIEDDCSSYINIKELNNDKSLEAYYEFISSKIKISSLEELDLNYKDFAKYKIEKKYKKAIESLFKMDKITSKLLSASLIKDKLSFDEVERLIDEASFYGYKKSVLFWLDIQKGKTDDKSKINKIIKKIEILE